MRDLSLETCPEFQNAMVFLREAIRKWAGSCKLDPDPENPLKNRRADNWRVLLAIADNLGRGEEARAAALTLSGGLPDDDPRVYLLEDIRGVFDALGVDRIASSVLLEKLHAVEGGMWLEWRGPNDDQQPHKLTANELARLLRDFKISPRTVSPLGSRLLRGPSSRGYFRRDFEAAWASYCTASTANAPTHRRIRSGCCARAASDHATAAPPSSVMNLRRPITR